MGVAMEKEIRPAYARRWNVYQEKSLAGTLEEQLPRQVEAPVVVAQDPIKWPTYRFNRIEGLLIAIVSEVPDLVGLTELARGGSRKPSVSIGNYSDEHEEF
jgi:hypothetical protein